MNFHTSYGLISLQRFERKRHSVNELHNLADFFHFFLQTL